MSDVLIILGMHRSGTSFLSSLLERSGLQIGSQLVEKDWSNPAGHFENTDFVDFQIQLLREHGYDFDVDRSVAWKFTPKHYAEARALLERHGKTPPWGWKDPRTCLFLDFWHDLIPNAKFIAVYRHYVPVVRSLMTRDYHDYRSAKGRLSGLFSRYIFQAQRGTSLANRYLSVWTHYNAMILELITKRPEDCILLFFDHLIRSNTIPYAILDSWGIHLQPVPLDPSVSFRSEKSVLFPLRFHKDVQTRADLVWRKLCNSVTDTGLSLHLLQ